MALEYVYGFSEEERGILGLALRIFVSRQAGFQHDAQRRGNSEEVELHADLEDQGVRLLRRISNP